MLGGTGSVLNWLAGFDAIAAKSDEVETCPGEREVARRLSRRQRRCHESRRPGAASVDRNHAEARHCGEIANTSRKDEHQVGRS